VQGWAFGAGGYGLFEDWSDINRSRDGYIRISDGLVSEGEIQEMNSEENFCNDGPYQACVRGFFLVYHQVVAYHWWLSFRLTDLERYRKFEVSLKQVMFIALLLVFFLSNGQKFELWYAHQASMNKALGLPSTIGLTGELVKNNRLGCEVVADSLEGPALDPSDEGQEAK
jgi:hypothetical protein